MGMHVIVPPDHELLCIVHRFRPLFLELAKTDETKLAVLKALAEFYTNNPQVHTYLIYYVIFVRVVNP